MSATREIESRLCYFDAIQAPLTNLKRDCCQQRDNWVGVYATNPGRQTQCAETYLINLRRKYDDEIPIKCKAQFKLSGFHSFTGSLAKYICIQCKFNEKRTFESD